MRCSTSSPRRREWRPSSNLSLTPPSPPVPDRRFGRFCAQRLAMGDQPAAVVKLLAVRRPAVLRQRDDPRFRHRAEVSRHVGSPTHWGTPLRTGFSKKAQAFAFDVDRGIEVTVVFGTAGRTRPVTLAQRERLVEPAAARTRLARWIPAIDDAQRAAEPRGLSSAPWTRGRAPNGAPSSAASAWLRRRIQAVRAASHAKAPQGFWVTATLTMNANVASAPTKAHARMRPVRP